MNLNKSDLRGNKSPADRIPSARSEHAGTIIRVTDYDPSKHLVKVVRTSDNLPLDLDIDTDAKVVQKKPFSQPTSKVIKTLDAPSAPILEVNNTYSSMRGNGDYGFFSFREGGGNIIKGPLSIATEPHQVRLSGVTTLNPLITSGFASTIVTPIPTVIFALPAASMIKPLLTDITIMATLVAAFGSVS